MTTERLERTQTGPEQLIGNVKSALENNLMNSFVLKGSRDEEMDPEVMVPLTIIPETGIIKTNGFAKGEGSFGRTDLTALLNSFEIPSYLKGDSDFLQFDPNKFKTACAILKMKDTPWAVLRKGTSKQTKQEIISIQIADGMSVEKAISAFREVAESPDVKLEI